MTLDGGLDLKKKTLCIIWFCKSNICKFASCRYTFRISTQWSWNFKHVI